MFTKQVPSFLNTLFTSSKIWHKCFIYNSKVGSRPRLPRQAPHLRQNPAFALPKPCRFFLYSGFPNVPPSKFCLFSCSNFELYSSKSCSHPILMLPIPPLSLYHASLPGLVSPGLCFIGLCEDIENSCSHSFSSHITGSIP